MEQTGRKRHHPGPRFLGSSTSLHVLSLISVLGGQGHVTTLLLEQPWFLSPGAECTWNLVGNFYISGYTQNFSLLSRLKWAPALHHCPLSKTRLHNLSSTQASLTQATCPLTSYDMPLPPASQRMRSTTTWTKKLLVFLSRRRCMLRAEAKPSLCSFSLTGARVGLWFHKG